MSKFKPTTLMPHARSLRIKAMFSCDVIHAFMPRKLGVNGHVVVNYARVAHAFSAGIKCQHCTVV